MARLIPELALKTKSKRSCVLTHWKIGRWSLELRRWSPGVEVGILLGWHHEGGRGIHIMGRGHLTWGKKIKILWEIFYTIKRLPLMNQSRGSVIYPSLVNVSILKCIVWWLINNEWWDVSEFSRNFKHTEKIELSFPK